LVRIAVFALVGVGCVDTSSPGNFVFQYQIGLYGCGTDCSGPGAAGIDTVARGDTAWLRHDIRLLQSSATTKNATVRPVCAQNVLVQTPATNVDTIPAPTCPDSLESHAFTLGDSLTRFNRWVVDSSFAPGGYLLVGRVMVQPRIEPQYFFVIK
jgi:hypothetical protein